MCLVTLVHDQLEHSPKTAQNVSGEGWMGVLSGLKTLLETGQPSSRRRPARVLQILDGMRIACATLVTALVVVAAGSAPAATPRLALVTCDDAARSVAQPGGTLYGGRLEVLVGLACEARALARSPAFPYWSKLPIFIRAGGRPFTIEIAPTWRGARNGLGQARGREAGDRAWRAVVPCPGGDRSSVWLAYPGGFYVERPACVPIVITIGAKRYRARVPLGRACP